jgi:molecular chaperone GrpE
MDKNQKPKQGASQDKPSEKIKELEKKAEEYLNGWKRERADFLNYKNQETERIGQLAKYANEEIIFNLLGILDNFNLASQHLKDQGFLQIKKQLEDLLAKEGIEPIEVMGKKFDPNTMDAIGESEIATSDVAISGTVAEEAQRGYTMHGKLIRPAKVKVTK